MEIERNLYFFLFRQQRVFTMMYRLVSYVLNPRPGIRFGPVAGPHQPSLSRVLDCAKIEMLNVPEKRIYVEKTLSSDVIEPLMTLEAARKKLLKER